MDEITKLNYMHGKDLEGKNEKLMPCPFCGSTDIELTNSHTPYYAAECQNCTATVHGECSEDTKRSDYEKAAESAIEKWNTRK